MWRVGSTLNRRSLFRRAKPVARAVSQRDPQDTQGRSPRGWPGRVLRLAAEWQAPVATVTPIVGGTVWLLMRGQSELSKLKEVGERVDAMERDLGRKQKEVEWRVGETPPTTADKVSMCYGALYVGSLPKQAGGPGVGSIYEKVNYTIPQALDQLEHRMDQRMDQLEQHMEQRMEQQRMEMLQRMDHLEQHMEQRMEQQRKDMEQQRKETRLLGLAGIVVAIWLGKKPGG